MTARPAGRARAALTALAALAVGAGCSAHGLGATTGRTGHAGMKGVPLVAGVGGTVNVAVDAVPTTLNDHTVAGDTAITRQVSSLVWPQVFQVGPNTTPTLDTTVVQSAEVVSVNPQTVVYQIDPRAIWSDGTPVSAQDFVYDWLAQSGPGRDVDGSPDSVSAPAGYRDIASVVGSNGGKTVTVVFQTPFADWNSLFDDLLPAHVAQRVGWNHGFDQFDPATLLSAGPFVVTAWTPGKRITLGRNPHWWGSAPKVDQIVVQAVPGAPAMAAALRAGSATIASPTAFDSTFEAQVSSSPTLQSSMSLGTTMLQLVFNTRDAPLTTPEVRQGIAHMLDRAALVTSLVQPLAPLAWEDNDHLFANAEPWYSDDAAGYVEPDPVTGAHLLTAAGLIADRHGTWTARGVPVTLQLAWADDDPWSAAVGPAIASQLVAAGFQVQTVPTTTAQLTEAVLPGGHFDVALAPLATGAYPTTLAAAYGEGPGVPLTSAHDWSGYDDPKLDALFAEASTELAADQAQGTYHQIDAALWTAMPTLPLFAEPSSLVWSASLSDVRDDPGGLGLFWAAPNWTPLVPAPTPASHPARTH